jgi:acetylglutamate kinase
VSAGDDAEGGTQAAITPADAVLRFLESVGPGSEAEFYLRTFRSQAPERFATLTVLASALEYGLDGVTLDLRFLRELGLTPVVVLGLYEPARTEEHAQLLSERLAHAGVQTEHLRLDGGGQAIRSATAAGHLPLVSSAAAGADVDGLGRMLAELGTHKLVLLRPQGGLRLHGERLSVVNLSTDYSALQADSELADAERRLLDDIRRLVLELVPHRLAVSITSPLDLLQELFTVKGAGTFLRSGARIARHDRLEGVDVERLQALLRASFGKPVREGFFDRPPVHSYVEQGYRGAALIAACPLGGYLSKFAVTREAQGEGLGQDLWSALTADHPALIWRARASNPIRAWYERQCQGRYDSGEWTVYTRGIAADRVGDAVAYAVAQPRDFD